jgi:8-oxo-dGTP diphosphatase
MPDQRVPCVGAIITDPAGRLLLIKRGHEPEAGRWSLPGGRIEPGESDEQALVREVWEETGLVVTPGRLVGTVDRPQPDGRVLVIRDYAAEVTGGELTAGDDAAGARWVRLPGFDGLPLTTGLREALDAWGGVAGSELAERAVSWSRVICRVASSPSIPGMRMSISTTSGPCAATCDTAASPLAASPTTVMPSAASRMTQNPDRTSS